MFGDMLMLFGPNDEALHLCVYVADDFVFTKNGVNPAAPWVIMRLEDVLVVYYPPEKASGKMLYLRRKT